jgi:hypothetical protein
MKWTPERMLIQFEMPAIFLIGALLMAAAAVNGQGLRQIATAAIFSASIVAVSFAIYVAAKYRRRWP